MSRCENKVVHCVPKGPYDYKDVTMRCGETGYWGDVLICDQCRIGAEIKEREQRKNKEAV